jgi:myosin heavy subunit
MSLLDEECVFPQGTDQSYLAKLTRQVRSRHTIALRVSKSSKT